MARLHRSALAHYISVDNGTSWYLIGKDITEMNVEMGGSFETSTNILDETSVVDTGYEPSMTVTPYYADPADALYDFMKDLAMNRKSGDDAKCLFMEVLIEDTSASSHDAWKEDAIIEITSYGGGTEGVNIEYAIHPTGNRVQGKVAISNKVPTWTP